MCFYHLYSLDSVYQTFAQHERHELSKNFWSRIKYVINLKPIMQLNMDKYSHYLTNKAFSLLANRCQMKILIAKMMGRHALIKNH